MKKNKYSFGNILKEVGFVRRNILFTITIVFFVLQGKAQVGTWTAITQQAPHPNMGVMLLLTDGSVITETGSTVGGGNRWDKLTPDIHGSYINGTWSTISPMHYQRYGFSTQVLKDGRVYVAGSEYYTGPSKCEIYNPQTNLWTVVNNPLNLRFGESNSMLLPDGKVLQGIDNWDYPSGNVIFDPATSTFVYTDSTHLGVTVEASWLLLPDHSILIVDYASTAAERFIPSLNRWIADAPVPISADLYGNSVEMGAGTMLPDGRAFFLGASGHTVYYIPSGDTTNGTWVQGPEIPDTTGTLDAPSAMMMNGKILFAASPLPNPINGYYPFNNPTNFYEFNYLTNSFSRTLAPDGTDSLDQPCQLSHLLNLPDGSILYSQGFTNTSNTYYIYTPNGAPNNAWKPTINTNGITQNTCYDYTITGTLFNGMSQGSGFGDDWQMPTNYPIVRLTSGANVYYATTHDWNNTGVQTGNLTTSTHFTVPATLPIGTYSLQVIANGIASDPTTFIYSTTSTTGVITGPSVVCQLTTATYSVAPIGGVTTYNWTLPSGVTGMTITSGQGTNTITANISAGTTTGNITVTAGNTCGTSTSSTLAVTKKPVTPATITGPTDICGLTSATYSIPPTFVATSYSWTIPAGMTLVSGAGTTAITVSIASTYTSGLVKVMAVNACGSTPGTQLLVTGKVSPSSIAGSLNVCGMTTATYSTPVVINANSYVWTVPATWSIASGQGTTSITANFPANVNNATFLGTVKVHTVNTCGNSADKAVTVSYCKSAITMDGAAEEQDVNLYPNPISNEFTLSINNGQWTIENGQLLLEIYNVLGEKVKQLKMDNEQLTINISDLSNGIYFVRLIDGDNNVVYNQRVIKE